MPISSNQYLQKISLEHPIALWSLDDDAYYVKLMSDSARDVGTWEDVNVASITNITPSGIQVPNPNRPCTEIVGQEIGGALYANAFIRSSGTFSASSKPFSISFNLYSYGTDIRYVTMAYQNTTPKTVEGVYAGPTSVAYLVTNHGFVTGDYVVVTGTVPTAANENWYDYSGVITKINNNAFYFQNHNRQYDEDSAPNEYGGEAFKGEIQQLDPWLYGRSDEWLFLSANFTQTATNAKIRIKIYYDGDYEKTFLINDLNVSQGSSEFSSVSNGQDAIALPSSIATTETHGVLATDLLSEQNKGYYIVKNNILKTKNSSIPMILGSSNTTILYSNNNGPSLIIPGFGLLNEYGRYKSYNLETFIRINGKTTTPKRIIGPIQSTDGVYVDGSFIVLKVNNLIKSAYIGEWSKPMMLNLQYSDQAVELWINGDKLITIDIRDQDIVLSEKIASSGALSGKDQDWIGFYSYDELESIEIDTVTIYPYVADTTLIKRRLLYAQAAKTSAMENLAIQSNGNFINFRYDVAGETKNYNFPTFSRWDLARVFDNLTVINNTLQAKQYSLPSFYLGSKTYTEWIEDQEAIQNEATSFISLKPDSEYDNINGYISFSAQEIIGETLSAIYAVLKKPASSGTEQRLITIYDTVTKNYFKVSLNGTTLTYILNYSGVDRTDIDTVITNIPMNTKITVGINLDTLRQSSDPEMSSFFRSSNLEVYIGGFLNESVTFDGRIYKIGLCNSRSASEISSYFTNGISDYAESLESNIATYTLLPKSYINEFMIDIATKSYWESSVFLSSLASYQDNSLDLDFMQINIDYPEYTTVSGSEFDISNEFVKSYISFQSNDSGLDKESFANITQLSTKKIIDATTLDEDRQYVFADQTLIYPSTNIDVRDYSLVIHLTIISHLLTYPTQIKYLEILGKSLPNTSAGTVTSQSAEKVEHFYIDANSVYDYKNNAGILITKESTSYLNLSNNSGITVVNNE